MHERIDVHVSSCDCYLDSEFRLVDMQLER